MIPTSGIVSRDGAFSVGFERLQVKDMWGLEISF